MSAEQRLGQLIMVAVTAARPAEVNDLVAQRGVGSVLYLGDGWTAAGVTDVSATLRESAGPVPPWLAVDQEGGQVARFTGPGFAPIPAATVQGTWEVAQLTSQAQVWGSELSAVGVNLNLAPVVDTVPAETPAQRSANKPIGAMDRDFGLSPQGNAARARAFIKGMSAAGVGTTVKHFPGLGRVQGNTDFTAQGTADHVASADDPAVQAFAETFSAQPSMVMMSLATYPTLDPTQVAAFSPVIVGSLLREQLGWDGVVISDSLSAAAVQAVPVRERAVRLVEAGGDIAVFSSRADAEAALDGLIERAAADPAFKDKAETAAGRVLQGKQAAGLLG
jgi:beta-N-acetylhexosaminidase